MPTVYGVAIKNAQPVPGVSVELVGEDGQVVATSQTDQEGTFQLQADAGTWTVRWFSSEGPQEGPLDIAEGEDAELEIEVD